MIKRFGEVSQLLPFLLLFACIHFTSLYMIISRMQCIFRRRNIFEGTRTIRTLVNSALVNSDPILFSPSQFGP